MPPIRLSETLTAITEIPFDLDADTLLKQVHLEPVSEDARTFERFVREAREIGKPKTIFKVAYIESRHDDSVIIDGVEFKSRALRMNLEKVERVFPYVATCGREIDRVTITEGDMLQAFWLDKIKTRLLDCSIQHLHDHLHRKYRPGKVANMSPGSGDAAVWPIEQQKALFSLLGNVEEQIGVELTGSFLMVPIKSVSGVLYPTEVDFESCMLCHREGCPSRRAPFKKKLWDTVHREHNLS